MKREQSSPTLSMSSSASSSSSTSSGRWCDYKKLNFIAFSSTLLYIGYLLGSTESSGQLVASALSISRGDEVGGEDRGRLRRAMVSDDASLSSSSSSPAAAAAAAANRDDPCDDAKVANAEQNPRGPIYAKGPVIHKNKGKATSISLIGERHSGTNWITDHLNECFGDQLTVEPAFTSFKHWFQFDDATVRNDSAIVVAMFRDPYDWVEAMREHPHHAHEHIGVLDTIIGLGWKDFVTKPWVGPRGPADHQKMKKAKEEGTHIDKMGCLAGYSFDKVVPCSPEDSVTIDGYSSYMYELRNDESARAFSSIVELRTAKILNFMSVATFHGVGAFFPERYEALNLRGTADFLGQLEEVTGLKAKCKPLEGTGVVKHKDVEPEFTAWMNKYHDWEAEELIGYVRRDPIPRRDGRLKQEQATIEAAGVQPPKSNAQVH